MHTKLALALLLVGLVAAGGESETETERSVGNLVGVSVRSLRDFGFRGDSYLSLKALADARLVPLAETPPLAETRSEPGGAGQAAAQGEPVDVWITFYTCPPYCGAMANGEVVHDGAAACGYAFDLGQRFSLGGRDYTCKDRGLGPAYWIDAYFADATEGWAWLSQVGSYGTVRLIP